QSAGSDPGPVCYDRGGHQVALTDASLCLGYLHQSRLPSGLPLNAGKAMAALRGQIAAPLQLSLAECAHGIFRLGCAVMARAVRAVTIERGLDPRKVALVAFGGNGPMFGVTLARSLDIRTVIIPPSPGVFSAVGLLEADIEKHLSRAFIRRVSEVGASDLIDRINGLKQEAVALLRTDGFVEEIVTTASLDMK